jgi:endonuclease YncB( thermonuclease family)
MSESDFEEGGLRVIDGDGVEYRGKYYRLAGYDAPEVRNLRSDGDKWVEWVRGEQAKLRLETLIDGARTLHLIDWGTPAPPGRRWEATLLINGWDVRSIAIEEGWGAASDPKKRHRTGVEWGDPHQPFPDDLPIPDHVREELAHRSEERKRTRRKR